MHFKENVMAIAVICLTCSAGLAQDASKQNDAPQKSSTTTVDTWRQSLPEGESRPNAIEEKVANDSEESFEDVEKKLAESEHTWLEAIRLHSASKLKLLLASDFTQASAQTVDALVGKKEYVANALRDETLTSFIFVLVSVRVYANTAVVSGSYNERTAVGAEPLSGNFIFTDVWVRLDGRWQAVSRHLSRTHGAGK